MSSYRSADCWAVSPVQPQVVQDEQVRGQEGPEGALQRVVHPAWAMALKKSSEWMKRTVYPSVRR